MRRMATVLWLALMPAVAAAQQGPQLRATEHPQYSRIVVPIGAGETWRLSQRGQSAVLRVAGADVPFEASGIFDRMPRTRILGVASRVEGDGVAVELTLGCTCTVVAEPIGSRFLALDVRRTEGGGGEVVTARSVGAAPADGGGTAGDPAVAAPDAAMERAPGPGQTAGLPEASANAPPPEPQTDDDAQTAARDEADPVLIARDSLIAQLSRAADEGLLDLAPEASDSVAEPAPLLPDPPREDPQGGTSDPMVARAGPDAPAEPVLDPKGALARVAGSAQLSVRSPFDRPKPAPQAIEAPDPACVPDEALDVEAWDARQPDPIAGIGQFRRALVREDGRLDTTILGELARYYIRFGFGREAAQLIAQAGPEDRDFALLSDLARIVDGLSPVPEGAIVQAAGCRGRVGLWRAVAGLEAFEPGTESGAEILFSLQELPPQLRRVTGEGLVRQALVNGRTGAAREIIGVLDSTPGEPSGNEDLLRTTLHLLDGRGTPDPSALAAAGRDGRFRLDPDLIALFASAVLAGDSAVPPGLTEAVTAAARPETGTGRGLELRLLQARLLARGGAAPEAFATLREASQVWPDAGARLASVAEAVFSETELGPPGTPGGLRLVLDHADLLGADARGARMRLTLARHLRESGLPNAARDLVAPDSGVPDADARMFLAGLDLESGDTDAALERVQGVPGAAAARLRAGAHLRRGDPAAAYAELRPLDPADADRNRLALLSENWAEIRPASLSSDFRPLAELMQGSSREGDAATSAGAATARPIQPVPDGDLAATGGPATPAASGETADASPAVAPSPSASGAAAAAPPDAGSQPGGRQPAQGAIADGGALAATRDGGAASSGLLETGERRLRAAAALRDALAPLGLAGG